MRPSARWSWAIAALLAILVVSAASSVGAAEITFDPLFSEIACGAQISIDLVVDDVTDLRGFSITAEFNPVALSLVAVNPGPDLLGAPCPHFFHVFPYVPGFSAVDFDGSGLGCSVSGPARIATLVFEGETEGIALLDCRSVILRNSLNLDVPATCHPAAVSVTCPVSATAQSWSTVKGNYR